MSIFAAASAGDAGVAQLAESRRGRGHMAERTIVAAYVVGRRRALSKSEADADALAQLPQAVLIVLAHHGVDERIDGRVGVGHKVHEPLDVGQPRGQTLRILHAQQHDLQRRPAHSEQNANDDEHCDHLFSTKKTSFIFFTKI